MASRPHIIDPHLNFPRGLPVRRGAPPGCVVHNAGGNGPVQSWHNYHLSLGWRGIAYNQCVMLDGDIIEGRGDDAYGGHTLNYGSWMGVVFEGNYNSRREMPKAQFDSGVDLLRYWLSEYGDDWPIRPHRDMPSNSTDCPGRHFPFAELVRAARGPEVNIVLLKQRMDRFNAKLKLAVAVPDGYNPDSPSWGPAAQTYAWRISRRLLDAGKLKKQTYRPTPELWKALA